LSPIRASTGQAGSRQHAVAGFLRAGAEPWRGLAKELGPIYWLDMMGAPSSSSPAPTSLTNSATRTRFDKAVRDRCGTGLRAVAGERPVTADTTGTNWAQGDNILMQPFGNRAMQFLSPEHVDIAEQLVKKWTGSTPTTRSTSCHDMTALTSRHHRAVRLRRTVSIRSTGRITIPSWKCRWCARSKPSMMIRGLPMEKSVDA